LVVELGPTAAELCHVAINVERISAHLDPVNAVGRLTGVEEIETTRRRRRHTSHATGTGHTAHATGTGHTAHATGTGHTAHATGTSHAAHASGTAFSDRTAIRSVTSVRGQGHDEHAPHPPVSHAAEHAKRQGPVIKKWPRGHISCGRVNIVPISNAVVSA
jgi:hypothetical protein